MNSKFVSSSVFLAAVFWAIVIVLPRVGAAVVEKIGSAASAYAELKAAKSTNLKGKIDFGSTPKGTKITAHITGLKPGSVHGFHIHEEGKCEQPDFKSAGGHFNPENSKHGHPAGEAKHVGDMGNVVANANGIAKVEMLLPDVELVGEKSVIGKTVILHSKADDLSSQPSGDAGDRIACGLISLNERK